MMIHRIGAATLLTVVLMTFVAPAHAQDEDIGLRMFDGVSVDSAAVKAGAASPMKVYRDGQAYGVLLVSPADPKATKTRVKMADGTIQAIKKYTPCDRQPLEPIPPGGICLGSGWCDKSGPSIEFWWRHLWSNHHTGAPSYITAEADKLWFHYNIVEADTGPLAGPPYNWAIACGDNASFSQACRRWGYAAWSQTYDHVMASEWDNCSVKWNGTRWVSMGCELGCGNKRLLCTNPLPQCSNSFDDDGDCSTDHAGTKQDPVPDPDCTGPLDNDESN